MDSHLLLVKCVTLMYLESKTGQHGNSSEFCKTVLNTIKVPETSMEIHSGEVILSLRNLILWMISQKEVEIDKGQLLQRLRVATKDNVYLYDAVNDNINSDDDDLNKKTIISYRQSLSGHIKSEEVKALIKNAYREVNFDSTQDTIKDIVRTIYSELEPYTHSDTSSKHPSMVDTVSFSDEDGLSNLMKRSMEEVSSDGVLSTGYQAINRMLGESKGFRRGEFVLVGALQHNFKSGFVLNLFKHMALYNVPYMRDSSKKPLLIFITLENELHLNIMWLYANLKENETGEPCDIKNVDIQAASTYIKKAMGRNGYHIEMFRLDPTTTTYFDLQDILISYETEGYEIHSVVCDYLNMISKAGIVNNGPTGTDIRALFRIIRNFTSPRGITFITPHQLSTEAKMLVRQGVENFVQEIANKGYYDGSRQIDQEVDLEILIHIEKVKGTGSFLTVARGKHRKIEITPDRDLTTVLPFSPVGGILDDVMGEDLSMTSVGAKRLTESSGAIDEEWFNA